jgi:hypothetical protein
MGIDPFILQHRAALEPQMGVGTRRFRTRSGRYLMIAVLGLLAVGMVAWTFQPPTAATGDTMRTANAGSATQSTL